MLGFVHPRSPVDAAVGVASIQALKQRISVVKDVDVDSQATAKAFDALHTRQTDSIVAIKRMRSYSGATFWVRVTVTRLKDGAEDAPTGARFLGVVYRTLPPSDHKAKVLINGRVFEFEARR